MVTFSTLSDLIFHRDGYVDQFDEWTSANTWSGERQVVDSLDVYFRAKLKVTVFGDYRRRTRPKSWCTTLEADGVTLTVGRGKCRTLKAVQAAVAALDITEDIKTLLKRLYAPERAYLVYRQVERPSVWGVITDRGAWEPWCTTFGYLTVSAENWPSGTFLAVRGDERRLVERTPWSVCTSSLQAKHGDFGWLPQKGAA
jgi:hypothetical protein